MCSRMIAPFTINSTKCQRVVAGFTRIILRNSQKRYPNAPHHANHSTPKSTLHTHQQLESISGHNITLNAPRVIQAHHNGSLLCRRLLPAHVQLSKARRQKIVCKWTLSYNSEQQTSEKCTQQQKKAIQNSAIILPDNTVFQARISFLFRHKNTTERM